MMRLELDSVAHFHKKMQVSAAQEMQQEVLQDLRTSAEGVLLTSKYLEQHVSDPDKRWLRAHLLLEEAAETVIAMAEGDEVKALDGLADLLYVLLGTAVTFRWPLEEAFAEVHVSNMTKV